MVGDVGTGLDTAVMQAPSRRCERAPSPPAGRQATESPEHIGVVHSTQCKVTETFDLFLPLQISLVSSATCRAQAGNVPVFQA